MPRLGSRVRVPFSAQHIEKNSKSSPGGGMVDALVSGTSVSNDVQVRVLFWALSSDYYKKNGEVAELVDALL